MDNLGRKPALLISLVGTIFRNLFFILQQALGLPLEVISLGYLAGTLTGGLSTFLTACFAYYADTVPGEKLGFRLTIADVVFGLMLAAMSVLVGFMIQYWGFLWPFVVVEGGHLINLVYIIFFVPESRKTQTSKNPVSLRYIVTSLKVSIGNATRLV